MELIFVSKKNNNKKKRTNSNLSYGEWNKSWLIDDKNVGIDTCVSDSQRRKEQLPIEVNDDDFDISFSDVQ